jgi:hypothetical protein
MVVDFFPNDWEVRSWRTSALGRGRVKTLSRAPESLPNPLLQLGPLVRPLPAVLSSRSAIAKAGSSAIMKI